MDNILIPNLVSLVNAFAKSSSLMMGPSASRGANSYFGEGFVVECCKVNCTCSNGHSDQSSLLAKGHFNDSLPIGIQTMCEIRL